MNVLYDYQTLTMQRFGGISRYYYENASCFPEIAGDACVYFDGKSESDIKSIVEKVLYDDGLKAELTEKGLSRARLYGWDKTVNNTLDLYKSLL